ncbi:hypothetical protein PMZ80_005935 [Knufia obscura]|uniref:Uncharacterized protein n=1 Tax=Knufia obscura TaxID=1635080 RepID=A0ABR0RN04_9EURO|nr:hypothetical protein PMZ80_005935 [Knufia obscura]
MAAITPGGLVDDEVIGLEGTRKRKNKKDDVRKKKPKCDSNTFPTDSAVSNVHGSDPGTGPLATTGSTTASVQPYTKSPSDGHQTTQTDSATSDAKIADQAAQDVGIEQSSASTPISGNSHDDPNIQEFTLKFEQAQIEINTLKLENSTLQAEKNNLNKRPKRNMLHLAHFRSPIQVSKNEIDKLRKKNNKLTTANEGLRERLKNPRLELRVLKARIRRLFCRSCIRDFELIHVSDPHAQRDEEDYVSSSEEEEEEEGEEQEVDNAKQVDSALEHDERLDDTSEVSDYDSNFDSDAPAPEDSLTSDSESSEPEDSDD